MSELDAKPGVLAGVGPARQSDLAAFSLGRLQLIRVRSHVNPPGDMVKWRDVGASSFILQLLSPYPARHPTSPQMFVEGFSRNIEAFLLTGVRYVEVHDEPNRADRGAGVSWRDGGKFGEWFEEVYHRLKCRFGEDILVGFPALASSNSPDVTSSNTIPEDLFLSQCHHALLSADWAALHVYWRTLGELRDLNGAMRCLPRYVAAFPGQHFVVTAFANVDQALGARARGRQYAEYITLMAQYERIFGVVGLLLRSGDARYRPFAWTTGDGRVTAIVEELASRPCLPDPRRVRLAWPTDVHRYVQGFGVHQKAYFESYRLTGGHNGVDLAVGISDSEGVPITAAIDGTVVQVALDDAGYGYHVRVRGYGPDGEMITLIYAHLSTIDVSVGMLVSTGDVLGWVDSSDCDGAPHLHLGMRVGCVRLPQTYNALNARPYLGELPQG